ncbi:MAG TPA: type II toxin-antitoxin system VapC family toxin [Verrucomicrobiae bacterium]|nr:type II toxin-antitoxin system VapC family toxin [Verrucomicrobiae bacterium]
MVAFADTGFIASLYLEESTSKAADAALGAERHSIPFTPLIELELRNSFNRAVQRRRITIEEREALWRDVESDIAAGFLVPTPIAPGELHELARQLSDRHTPVLGTRSLDLLHVAAALILETEIFFSFDEHQRKVAARERLKVKPLKF